MKKIIHLRLAILFLSLLVFSVPVSADDIIIQVYGKGGLEHEIDENGGSKTSMCPIQSTLKCGDIVIKSSILRGNGSEGAFVRIVGLNGRSFNAVILRMKGVSMRKHGPNVLGRNLTLQISE